MRLRGSNVMLKCLWCPVGPTLQIRLEVQLVEWWKLHCLQAQLFAAMGKAFAVRRACACQLCVLAQAIYDAKQRTELDMARREQEIKQLQGARACRISVGTVT